VKTKFRLTNRKLLLAFSIQFLLSLSRINAATADANGNVLPDANDGKSTLIENSKGKEVPVEKSWCETPSLWEVRIGLPAWLAGLSGDSGVKGVVDHVDVGIDQLIKHLTHFPVALSAEVRYQRWELFVDGQYIEVGTPATLPGLLFTDANVHIKNAFAEGFLGYRLINCDKASLSLFAGARWTYFQGDLSIFDNGDARLTRLRELLGIQKRLDFSNSLDFADPVIGMRGKVKIWKPISFYAEGDVGGFDANFDSAFELHRQGRTIVRESVDSSDWSYQVQGGLEFQLTRSIWSQLGWRYLKHDYRTAGFTDKTALNGPFLQTGINF
jgi:opacity protein-like surface antigen